MPPANIKKHEPVSIAAPSMDRLCLHTRTTKPWNFAQCVQKYSAAGVKGVSVWRDVFDSHSPAETAKMLGDNGLSAVSLVRGGFFTSPDAATRKAALDDNRTMIDEAAALGAPLIVLVCGATPGQDVTENLAQIQDGIAALAPDAEAAGVKLAIEPLHPVYAGDRSAVATMADANNIAEAVGSKAVGVAVDIFHVWWDSQLEAEIARCGAAGNLLAFHVCDFKADMTDILNDRGLMGEGVANIPLIRSWVEAAGFNGFVEVEIFSDKWWSVDQDVFLAEIVKAYKNNT